MYVGLMLFKLYFKVIVFRNWWNVLKFIKNNEWIKRFKKMFKKKSNERDLLWLIIKIIKIVKVVSRLLCKINGMEWNELYRNRFSYSIISCWGRRG